MEFIAALVVVALVSGKLSKNGLKDL